MNKRIDNIDEIKALHSRIRKGMNDRSTLDFKTKSGWRPYISHREMLLMWAFVRGFKYRRIERTTRENNKPYFHIELWNMFLPDVTKEQIQAWLEDPTGAIPAPPPRPKKPYIAAAE